jgi:hypothetical protein
MTKTLIKVPVRQSGKSELKRMLVEWAKQKGHEIIEKENLIVIRFRK